MSIDETNIRVHLKPIGLLDTNIASTIQLNQMAAVLNISQAQTVAAAQQAKVRGYQGPIARVIKVDNQIAYLAGTKRFTRPESYCFDEFLIDHLKHTFGKQWVFAEAKLPRSKQHIIMQWMTDLFDEQRRVLGENHDPKIIVALIPTGSVMSIISLADDLYRLRLVDRLPDKLVKRLRKRESFQGARYELALAASFVRSGFEIDWIENEIEKHGEFEAALPATTDRIIVEAKSRRRAGVLHEVGSQLEFNQMTAGVRKLYERALKKKTNGVPFMICIDVNLPLAVDDHDSRDSWYPEIQKAFKSFPKSTDLHPSKEFCLAFTNFGWHYSGRQTAAAHQTLYTFPNFVQAVPQNMETFAAVIQALDKYGQRPEVLGGH